MSYGLLCLAMAYFTHLMGESVLQVSSVDPGWNQMMMMVVVVVVDGEDEDLTVSEP